MKTNTPISDVLEHYGFDFSRNFENSSEQFFVEDKANFNDFLKMITNPDKKYRIESVQKQFEKNYLVTCLCSQYNLKVNEPTKWMKRFELDSEVLPVPVNFLPAFDFFFSEAREINNHLVTCVPFIEDFIKQTGLSEEEIRSEICPKYQLIRVFHPKQAIKESDISLSMLDIQMDELLKVELVDQFKTELFNATLSFLKLKPNELTSSSPKIKNLLKLYTS